MNKRGDDLFLANSKSNNGGIRIDHGTDRDVTRKLEKEFGKQGIAMREEEEDEDEDEEECEKVDKHGVLHYQAVYGTRTLSFQQKNSLTETKNPVKIAKTNIDFKYLTDNQLTMDDLLVADLNLLDIYFSIGAKTWSDLTKLEMDKKYLLSKKGEFIPLDELIDLYDVDYVQLGLSLKDVADLDIDAMELNKLDMNFESLLDAGLTKATMDQMKGIISCGAWIKYLGMNKGHLIKLKMTLKHFTILGWDM